MVKKIMFANIKSIFVPLGDNLALHVVHTCLIRLMVVVVVETIYFDHSLA